jgi:phosphatidylinositol-3-phosphatase
MRAWPWIISAFVPKRSRLVGFTIFPVIFFECALGDFKLHAGQHKGVPAYDHIVLVIEENHSYNDIVGDSTDAPYINTTLIPEAALMTNSFALAHPSEPNYFALYAGSTFGIRDDGTYNKPDPTLFTILNRARKTFTGYVEDSTVRRHNPWQTFPEGVSVEKNFASSWPTNFTRLPKVSFVIPSLNDDMHNGTISRADTWLKNNLGAYIRWCQTHNSLFILTFDEDDGTQNNQILTLFIGHGVIAGTSNTHINHYNVLRTVLASEHLMAPRDAVTATPITSIFQTVHPTPTPHR